MSHPLQILNKLKITKKHYGVKLKNHVEIPFLHFFDIFLNNRVKLGCLFGSLKQVLVL